MEQLNYFSVCLDTANFHRKFDFKIKFVSNHRRQQLGGAIIACDGFSRDEDYERFAEDWCWSKGIYTIKEAYEMRDRASPYPGRVYE